MLHIFVISSRKKFFPVKKYKIFHIFTDLGETSSCFSAVQIVFSISIFKLLVQNRRMAS